MQTNSYNSGSRIGLWISCLLSTVVCSRQTREAGISNIENVSYVDKLERNIASDIRIFTVLSNFYCTLLSVKIALNVFVKKVVVDSQINNFKALLSNFVFVT